MTRQHRSYFLSLIFSLMWTRPTLSCPCFCPDKIEEELMTIQVLSYQGSGCPPSSIMADISPDKQVATMIFSNFVVDKDGRSEKYQKQKFCRVTFSILTSPLFSSAGFNLRTEGSFDIEKGARADQENFYYSESRPQGSVLDTFIETGYKSDDYRLESNSTMVGKDLSICNKYNQTVSVSSRLRINPTEKGGNNSSGFISLDLLEFKLPNQQDYRWKDCEASLGFRMGSARVTALLATMNSLYFLLS